MSELEVVAYAEVIDGKVVSVRLDESRHCTEPLVTLTSAQVERELWRQNGMETWEAMQTMRNDINEHIHIPSLESDLLHGPENSVFCAIVAAAVIEHTQRIIARAEAAERERDALREALDSARNLPITDAELARMNNSAVGTDEVRISSRIVLLLVGLAMSTRSALQPLEPHDAP